MRLSNVCAIVLTITWLGSAPIRAQSPAGGVQTTAGVHTVTFETPQGTIRVHVSADAAPGDSISGVIRAEGSGATPQARETNQRRLAALALEFQEQRTAVSRGRYEWLIPAALRTGLAPLLLRDADGAVVLRSAVPIDPVPVPTPRAGSPPAAFELPTEGEIGETAVIRGRSDGALTGSRVTVGGIEAELLAASPRQLAFRVPAATPGVVPIRFVSADRTLDRTFRAFDLRLSVSRTTLLRGQRAELTITVRGLAGITEPVTLTVVNQSANNVRIDGIDRSITIAPNQARAGTFAVTRRITGIQPGPFQISAGIGKPPSAEFDVLRSAALVMDGWQARTGVAITPDANALIQRAVVDARRLLDEFLNQQRASQGDVQEVFAALLSHYCFDLRDDGIARRRADVRPYFDVVIRPVALQQNRSANTDITSNDVQRQPFSEVLSRLVSRFTARQAVGYLFVRSMPREAPITIDGQRRGELTDRRLVTPVGDHEVIVRSSRTCRQRVIVSAFQTAVVDCAP
jgi:hypothetical protein